MKSSMSTTTNVQAKQPNMLTNDLFWAWIYSIVHSLCFSSRLFCIIYLNLVHFTFLFSSALPLQNPCWHLSPHHLHNSFFVYFLDIHVAFISFMPISIANHLHSQPSRHYVVLALISLLYVLYLFLPTNYYPSFLFKWNLAFFFLSSASREWEVVPLILWDNLSIYEGSLIHVCMLDVK